ncbi:hypothetical protein [Variovorax sp. LjRoot178]|uniref:hypothetical protein n=1 Tax=Variovorax sp. LjRoot178 TaxID=3342277 RepID=UPI003ECDDDD8
MKKPYVIIHTLTSLDGRIHNIELPEFDSAALQYEQLALHADQQVLNIQGYLNGRGSTDDKFTHYRQPDLNESADTVPEGGFVAEAHAPTCYVALDPAGRLGWQEPPMRKNRLAVRPPCRSFPGFEQPAHPATPNALVRVSQRTQRMQNRPTQP